MRSLVILPIAAALIGAADAPASVGDRTAILPLEPIAVAISDSGRVGGRLAVTIAVQGADAEALKGRMPVLRGAALAEIAEFARLHATPSTPVDVAALSAALSRAMRDADPQVSGVLILQVSARHA